MNISQLKQRCSNKYWMELSSGYVYMEHKQISCLDSYSVLKMSYFIQVNILQSENKIQ